MIKKIAKYISSINKKSSKSNDEELNMSNNENEFESTVISSKIDIFENLFNFTEDKEFKSVIKMAQGRENIKSKYIFKETQDLFN